MALIDSEGFGLSASINDYLTYGVFANLGGSGGGTSGMSSGGPFGDNYVSNTCAGNGARLSRTFPSAAATSSFFGIRFNFNGNTSTATDFTFYDTLGNAQSALVLNPGGTVQYYRGAQATLLGTSGAGVLSISGWQFVEIGQVIDAAAGTVEVRINGVSVLSLTGLNNKGSGSGTNIQAFRCGGNTTSQLGGAFTHMYFNDNTGSAPNNTFLGDVRVQTLLPASNDAVAFTPTGLSNNWQNAAKVPPLPASDYNIDSTVGDQDTFNCGTISSGLSSVFAVNVKTLQVKNDAGIRTGEALIKSSGTIQAGTAVGLSASYQQVKLLAPLDPATGVAWTQAGINAMKIGYKVAS